MTIHLDFEKIISEIKTTLDSSNFDDLENFISKIITANNVLVYGAGRVGLMMKTFAMRLTHLEMQSYFVGDVNLPRAEGGDLLIIGSGSGETKTVLTVTEIAIAQGLDVIAITADLYSSISKLSSSVVHLNCETKKFANSSRKSIQPLTTLFEQSLLILLDSIVLVLMEKLNKNHASMLERHNTIE